MNNVPPVKVTGLGGRQARFSPDSGQVFDHFGVVYEWANGVRMFHFSHQINGTDHEVNDWIRGTKGTCFINASGGGRARITGDKPWTYEGEFNDMYQTEHNELFASIRKGTPINDGEWMLQSTLLAILGRTAAYTGKVVRWEDALKSEVSFTPKVVQKNGFTFCELPRPKVAIPGQTKLTDNLW
jgi:hypothetical protein